MRLYIFFLFLFTEFIKLIISKLTIVLLYSMIELSSFTILEVVEVVHVLFCCISWHCTSNSSSNSSQLSTCLRNVSSKQFISSISNSLSKIGGTWRNSIPCSYYSTTNLSCIVYSMITESSYSTTYSTIDLFLSIKWSYVSIHATRKTLRYIRSICRSSKLRLIFIIEILIASAHQSLISKIFVFH